MKIKIKLELIMILLVTLPLLIINLYVSSAVREKNHKDIQKRIVSFTEQQAADATAVFQNSSAQIKKIAAMESVGEFVASTSKSLSAYTTKSFAEISRILKDYQYYNDGIQLVCLVDNAGEILVSSEPTKVEVLLAGVDIASLMKSKSSLSAQNIVSIGDSSALCVLAEIYSTEGEVIGAALQLQSMYSLQTILNRALAENTSNFSILVDTSGEVLERPYIRMKNYRNTGLYLAANDYFENAIRPYGNLNMHVPEELYYNKTDYLLFKSNVLSTNWTLITFTNQAVMGYKSESILLFLHIISALLLLLFIGGVVLYSRFFCRPLERIIDVLAKKQRGDMDVRFDILTQDELGQISQAFNTVFDAVSESEQRYRSIVEITDNIVFEMNFQKNTVFVSRNFNQKFSFRPKSNCLQDSFFYKGRIHKEDKERFSQDFNKILGKSDYFQGEYRFKNIYGDFAWFLIRATKFTDREGIPAKIVGVIVDIDREKRSEMHLLQRASFDALTQLYNRETFLKTLAAEFELSNSRKSLDALLFIDLDDFKHYNDDYGHSCGDEVLKFVSESLKETISGKGFAGRFGGDEFVICLTNLQHMGDAGKIAQDIIDVLAGGFASECHEQPLSVYCSIGIAFFYKNGKTCDELVHAADEAMYSVKKHGKSNFTYVMANEISIRE